MSETQTTTAPAGEAQPQQTTGTTTTGQTQTADHSTAGAALFPGDQILPGADTIYDTRKTINAAPEDVWPWIVQWGKGRGGWYVPSKLEKVLPEKYRSTPTINPEWQALKVGDKVPDYGVRKKGGDEYHLEVAQVESQRALVYKGERLGMTFTWALLLETPNGQPANTSSGASTASATETVLHLRFRGKSSQTGWKAKVSLQLGKVADGIMASAMFPGIVDRVEQQEKKPKTATATSAPAAETPATTTQAAPATTTA